MRLAWPNTSHFVEASVIFPASTGNSLNQERAMAKAQKPERGAKSQAIREYFSKNPKATIKEAHEGLAAAGHKVLQELKRKRPD